MRKISFLLSAFGLQLVVITSFISLFLFILPTPAKALYRQVQGSNNFKDYWFSIYANNDEPNPPEFVKDTGNIIVNVTAWKGGSQESIFTVNDRFDIFFENKSTNYKCRRAVGYDSTDTIDRNPTADQLTFNISARNIICDLTPGTYTVSAWSSRDDKPWFVLDDFPINSPAGGSSAKLVAKDQPNLACMNKASEAIIENAEEGKIFNVYWKGDLGQYAWQGTAPSRNFPISLKGPEGGMKAGSKLELCMIEGSVNFVPAVQFFACSNPLTFDVKSADDPACTASNTPSCEAKVQLMENQTAKKQAIIIGKNFPVSTQVRGDLINKTTQNILPKYNIPVSANGTVTFNTDQLAPGNYSFYFYPQDGDTLICSIDLFNISDKVESGNAPNPDQIDFKSVVCDPKSTNAENRCANASGVACDTSTGRALTQDEVNAGKKGNGVYTAVGCIPTDPGLFVAGALKYLTGFSGGAALLMMVYGAFQMLLSQGNADALKKGREQFVSAIIGLLFVIFAVLLLQIIGVDLLGLPGFKK